MLSPFMKVILLCRNIVAILRRAACQQRLTRYRAFKRAIMSR